MKSRSMRVVAHEENSLDRYLREISVYPLLKREEEIELARKAREGDEEAIDELVRANLRFVVSVAKRYQDQGVPLDDLINEGNLGLMRAARRFDERRGVKFISYAVWWIRQAILQALAEQGRIVRVPVNRANEIHRIGRRRSRLLQELGREPTLEEVASDMELRYEEVEQSLRLSQAYLSLDAPVAPDNDIRLMDYIADLLTEPPDASIYDQALTEMIEEVLSTVSEREARILRLYYGIDSPEPKTLEEIGALLGISRERVRQIKERALARMRHASRARLLDAFHT